MAMRLFLTLKAKPRFFPCFADDLTNDVAWSLHARQLILPFEGREASQIVSMGRRHRHLYNFTSDLFDFYMLST